MEYIRSAVAVAVVILFLACLPPLDLSQQRTDSLPGYRGVQPVKGTRAEPVTVNILPELAEVHSSDSSGDMTTQVLASDDDYAVVEDNADAMTPHEYIQLDFPDLALVQGVSIQSVTLTFEHHEEVEKNAPPGDQSGLADRPDDISVWNGTSWLYVGDYIHRSSDFPHSTGAPETTNKVLSSDDPIALINNMKFRVYIGNLEGNNTLYLDWAFMTVTYEPYKPPVMTDSIYPAPSVLTTLENFTTTFHAEFTDENNQAGDFTVTVAIRGPGASEEVTYVLLNKDNSHEDLVIEDLGDNSFHISLRYDPDPDMAPGLYDLYILILDGEGGRTVDGFDGNQDELELVHDQPPHILDASCVPKSVNKLGHRSANVTMQAEDGDALTNDLRVTVILKHRSSSTTYVLVENATSNHQALHVLDLGAGEFNITYGFDPPDSYEDGYYDAFLGIGDGLSYVTSDYDSNQNFVYIFFAENNAPEPPSQISPTKTYDARPEITWNQGYDADSDPLTYEIRIGENSGGDEIVSWTGVADRSYRPVSPLAYGIYYVGVRVCDGMDYSDPFEVALEIATDNDPPHEVSAIYPDVTTDTGTEIWWEKSYDPEGDALTYEIRIGTSSGGDDVLPWQSMGSVTSYFPAFKFDFTTYYVGVRAYDGIDYSPVHEETLEVLKENKPPSPPAQISLNTRDTTPNITWSGASDPDGSVKAYYIRVGRSSGNDEFLPWTQVPGGRYEVRDFALDRGKTVWVSVMSHDGLVNSTVKEQDFLMSSKANSPPLPEQDTLVMNSTPGKVLISWNPFEDPDGDSLEYSIAVGSSNGETDLVDWTGLGKKISYTTGPLPAGTYYVTVKCTEEDDKYDGEGLMHIVVNVESIDGVYSDEVTLAALGDLNLDLVENESDTLELEIRNVDVFPALVSLEVVLEGNGFTYMINNATGSQIIPRTLLLIPPLRNYYVKITVQRESGLTGNSSGTVYLMNASGSRIGESELDLEVSLPEEKKEEEEKEDYTPYLVAAGVILALLMVVFLAREKISLLITRREVMRRSELEEEVKREISDRGGMKGGGIETRGQEARSYEGQRYQQEGRPSGKGTLTPETESSSPEIVTGPSRPKTSKPEEPELVDAEVIDIGDEDIRKR